MKTKNNAVAAKLAANPLFPTLINKISKIHVGKEFTIRGCFSAIDWDNQPKKTRLSLGRLFKNNVDLQNISGIEAISRKLTNNTQLYRITGTVSFVEKFIMSYLGYYENYGVLTQELPLSESDAILFYETKKIGTTLDITVVCRQCNQNKKSIFSISKQLEINDNINPENPNIPAIKAIWLSLITLWLNENNPEMEGIQNIYLFSSNRSMMERCAGYRTDTSNNQDYETIIQSYFKDFIAGNRMQLSHKIKAVALNQATYHNLINSFNNI